MPDNVIRVGSRGSRLALSQTKYVISLLERHNPGTDFKAVTVKTEGDRDVSTSLEKMGGIGVFTKKIEKALLERSIDVAVHSAKDLPSIMTDGLEIGAVPPRESCEDVWISRDGAVLSEIRSDGIVGTGSPRRRAMLLRLRPDLRVADIRGNVETRLRKMENGDYDGLIMAYAGLKRTGLEDRVTSVLSEDDFLPAPGQGFLAVQIREDDWDISRIVTSIDDSTAHRCLNIERGLLQRLNAGCSAAVGGLARFADGRITLRAVVLDKNGKRRLYAEGDISPEQTDEMLVNMVTERLFSMGAGGIIKGFGE